MKHLLALVVLVFSMLLLTSCNNLSSSKTALAEDRFIDKQVIFFTDEKNVSKEISYYDAIIELKNEYPEGLKHLKVVSLNTKNSKEIVKTATTSPAIVVVENNQVIFKVEGKVSKEQIVNPVSNVIEKWE
ncbi:hypothetical protein [Rossellomorea aquimaris]|uniref:hypothetical protein n=1 Tax=Rossellomorea aquimaris TaxID=189382 RepID=UPI0009ED4B17|nr:hypothetical protein [Rossellomorea aquimaris]